MIDSACTDITYDDILGKFESEIIVAKRKPL